MYVEVILQRRLPRNFPTLTYEVPKGMKVKQGQIIQVPFGKQEVGALVLRTSAEKPKFQTKTVSAVTDVFLPPRQFAFAVWMSTHYKVQPHTTFQFFIPKQVWKDALKGKIRAESETAQEPEFSQKKAIPKALADFLSKFFIHTDSGSTVHTIFEQTRIDREKFYSAIVQRTQHMEPEGQVLFLVPEKFHAEYLSFGLPVFHGTLAETKKATLWHGVAAGKIRALIGTRAALLLPFKKLSCIVLDFAEHESYTEQRSPYYKTQEIAEQLAQQYGCPLISLSSAPNVESWHRSHPSQFTWQEPAAKIPTTIIDMEQERKKGNRSLFSEYLLAEMNKRFIQDEQILLVMNRVGSANALFCTDCNSVFRCATCLMPFGLRAGVLRCDRCRRTAQMPEGCPGCGNVELKALGFGTEKIEAELTQRFAKARILRLDRDTMQGASARRQALSQKKLEAADIIVATQVIHKPLVLKRLTLGAALYPDQLLQFPDFRASERAFQFLTRVRHLISNNGEFIIQSLMPDHEIYQKIALNTAEEFYESEIEARRMLSLPPFQK